MTRRTHMAIAILSSLIASQYMDTPKFELISGAINTAMLPDVDQKLKCFRHRGMTHSIIIPAVLYMGHRYLSGGAKYIILGLAIGWLSHIIIDMLNGKGAEIFWPSQKNYKIMDIKYNGKGEKAIFVICVIGIIISMIGVGNIKIIAEGWMK